MTRLNPQTTPRHELRAEKAARNREAALARLHRQEGRDRRRCSPACRRSATTISTPTPTR